MKEKILGVLGILALTAALGAAVVGLVLWENRGVTENATFLFAGTVDDADCSILLSAGSCVVIDTGEAQDGEHIAQLLQEQGVRQIDCMILTHPDKDHVGGASCLMDRFPVKQLVLPDYTGEKKAYAAMLEQAERLGIPVEVLFRSRRMQYGELELRIFPPRERYYEKSNNYSLAIAVRHGACRLFWAGDAQKKRIGELMQLDLEPVQLYHVAYHGRDTARSGELLQRLEPRYAVVSAAQPEQETQALLSQMGATVVSTRGQDCAFVSSGEDLQFNGSVRLGEKVS